MTSDIFETPISPTPSTLQQVRIRRKALFHEKLHHRSLLRSLQDSLRAAALLPHLWTNPSRAAEAFYALGRFDEAAECFRSAARAATNDDVRGQFLSKAKLADAEAQRRSLIWPARK